jgi:hypothetical protein
VAAEIKILEISPASHFMMFFEPPVVLTTAIQLTMSAGRAGLMISELPPNRIPLEDLISSIDMLLSKHVEFDCE